MIAVRKLIRVCTSGICAGASDYRRAKLVSLDDRQAQEIPEPKVLVGLVPTERPLSKVGYSSKALVPRPSHPMILRLPLEKTYLE